MRVDDALPSDRKRLDVCDLVDEAHAIVDVDDGGGGLRPRPKQLGKQHNKIIGPICGRPLHFAVFMVCACNDAR